MKPKCVTLHYFCDDLPKKIVIDVEEEEVRVDGFIVHKPYGLKVLNENVGLYLLGEK